MNRSAAARRAPLLLLDIGNTRLKWALAEDGALLRQGAVGHDGAPAAVLQGLTLPAGTRAWVANVTGAAHEAELARALQALCGAPPTFARSAAAWHSLRSGYAEPERLGVDRWLGLIAAWSEAAAPCCVVSAGTALTVDCIDAEGSHLGGLIAGGLETQQRGVLGQTRFATRPQAADAHQHVGAGLGRDTEACVHQGALLACLGAIDRAWVAGGRPERRLITGGDALRLLPQLGAGWQHRPNLVLEGLQRVAGD